MKSSTATTRGSSMFVADVVSYSDYYPFGMLLPNRNGVAGDDYRYAFNGQEKDDEVAGEANSYTAEFWEYSPRIGRRWNLDPVVKIWESPYLCFSGNPVIYADPKGDDVIGLSKRSANRTRDIIKNSFSQKHQADFRKLIKVGSDGKTFQHISQTDFDNATKNFSADEKALAKGYFDAINDDNKHRVGVLKRNEKIGDYIGSMNVSFPVVGTLTKNSTGADIDNGAGGGFNSPINSTEDVTIIIMDSKVGIRDYRNTNTRKYLSGITSSAGELLSHEMLGHGLTLYNDNNNYTQWVNAIRMTNLYLRVMGINDRYRDGSAHGGHSRVPGNSAQMTKIPDYLKP